MGIPTNNHNQGSNKNAAPGSHADALRNQLDDAPAPALSSWSTMTRSASFGISRNQAGGNLLELDKVLGEEVKKFEKTRPRYQFWTQPVDRGTRTDLALSAITVMARDQSGPTDSPIAYFTLIVEASGDGFVPTYQSFHGMNVELQQLPSDVYSADYRSSIHDELVKSLGTDRLIDCDAMVVPTGFDTSNKDDVRALAANAASALLQSINDATGEILDLCLDDLNKQSEIVCVRPFYQQPGQIDAAGLPVRSDVVVETNIQAGNGQQNAQPRKPQTTTNLLRVGGYIDMLYNPVARNGMGQYAQQQQLPMYGYQPMTPTQLFSPALVITKIDSAANHRLPFVLLGLCSSYFLAEQSNWQRSFHGKHVVPGIDWRNFGGVGVEANFEKSPTGFGGVIDTKSDSFRPEHLSQLIMATCRNELSLQLDVPECGAESWIVGTFGAAGEGNKAANDMIIAACNFLTGGRFGKYWDGSQTICTSIGRIHMGYYGHGENKKDLRELDYLAMANIIGEQDPAVLRDFSDTYANMQMHPAIRLSKRKQIIQQVLGETVTFTGFATRVVFNDQWIRALIQACLEAGLKWNNNTGYDGLGGMERATADWLSAFVSTNGATGAFQFGMPNGGWANQGWGNQGWGNNQQYNQTGRWG